MHLYHSPGTRSTRAIWAFEEIGHPYDVTVLTKDERQGDEHRKLHPLGRVPVLTDDAGPILESAAICLHIADLRPDAGLNWPLGTHERALVYQWVVYAMLEVETPIVDMFRAGDDHPDLAESAKQRCRSAAEVVENALADSLALVGGRFSVADIVCGSVLSFARSQGLVDGMPRIAAYLEALEARPARQKANAAVSS
jgi:glutathione S-transferase